MCPVLKGKTHACTKKMEEIVFFSFIYIQCILYTYMLYFNMHYNIQHNYVNVNGYAFIFPSTFKSHIIFCCFCSGNVRCGLAFRRVQYAVVVLLLTEILRYYSIQRVVAVALIVGCCAGVCLTISDSVWLWFSTAMDVFSAHFGWIKSSDRIRFDWQIAVLNIHLFFLRIQNMTFVLMTI